MNIKNGTPFVLRAIHQFDLFNPETSNRVLLDVIEPINADLPFVAIPNLGNLSAAPDEFRGIGNTRETAIDDFFLKIASKSWKEIENAAGAMLSHHNPFRVS